MIKNNILPESLFISRTLAESSPVRKLASDRGLAITDQSLLNFRTVKFHKPNSRWLFFYSKQGVKSFVEGTGQLQSDYRAICFGNKTAEFCSQYMDVFASANTSPSDAIRIIKSLPQSEKVTFICGKYSLRSVHRLLPHSLVEELVVYDQYPKEYLDLGIYTYAILTSPMNAETFFLNEGRAKNYIAIGRTTGACLSSMTENVYTASEPSEEGIADVLSALLKN